MRPAVVLCIGNAFRRDDGVGPAVADALGQRLPDALPGTDVVALDGEPARLVDAWTEVEVAVVVDACRSGAPPGTVTRLEIDRDGPPPALAPVAVTSTHAASVGEAIALGRALGRMPARVVVYAVEGEDFSPGPGLSDPVAAVVDEVADHIVAELGRQGAGADEEASV